MSESKASPIPSIVIGQDYDTKYAHAPIHYDSLNNLASFFGRRMHVHRHPKYWQIHLVKNGASHFHIDDRQYNVDGPCCFLTPAAVPHSFQTEANAEGHVITVDQSLLWELAKERSFDHFNLGRTPGFCIAKTHCKKNQQDDWQLLEQTLNNIKNEWQQDSTGKAIIIDSLTRILLVTLLRLSPITHKGSIVEDEDLRIFRKFSDAIEANFTQHCNLTFYTENLGVSENRLNQICQRICSNSPKKLINERLLQEACRLLSHTSSSCNEISYELGFSDPTYFSRFFKKHLGHTAQEYRKTTTIS